MQKFCIAVQVTGCTRKSKVPFKLQFLKIVAVTVINSTCTIDRIELKSRITKAEVTPVPQKAGVVQKPHQGTIPGKGRILSRVSFFGSFLRALRGQAKKYNHFKRANE